MSEGFLLLMATAGRPSVGRWALVDPAAGAVLEEGAGLPAPERARAAAGTALILPGMEVVSLAADLPRRVTAQVRSALPLLLEDRLAGPGAACHCAVGRKGGGDTVVAVVDRTYLSDLLAGLASAGFTPDRAVADYMLLPTAPGQACIVETADGVLIARPDGRGCAVEKAMTTLVVDDFLAGGPAGAVWYGATELPLASVTVSRRAALSGHGLLQMFAAAVAAGQGIDLLQGAFRRRTGWRLSLPHWRRTAALTAAAGLLAVAWTLAAGWQMNRQAAAIDHESGSRMQAVFPGVRNLGHMRAKIRELEDRGSDRFLAMAWALFDAAGGLEGVSLSRIQFDGRRNQLRVDIRASGLGPVEDLKAGLAARLPVQVTETPARQAGGRLEATLIMELLP